MKKLLTSLLLFIAIIGFGQTASTEVKLTGTLINPQSNELVIYKFDKSFEITIPVERNGNFSAKFKINEPGFYFIKQEKAYTNIFLRNGYNLKLNLDTKSFPNSIQYEGEGAVFNNYMKTKSALNLKLVGDAKVFFVVPIEDFIKKIAADSTEFFDQLRTAKLSKEDEQLARKLIHYDYLLKRNNYRKFYVFHTKAEPFIPENYLDPIRNLNMNDAEAYNNSMDYRYLIVDKWRLLDTDKKRKDSTSSTIDFTREFANTITYEPVRDQIVRMLFNKVDARNPVFEAEYLAIKPLVRVEKTKAELDMRLATARSNSKGNVLAGFNYENHAGGLTSLSSLKGKYVYIDIWATWCGPCIKEFPELKKLMDDYKGNANIEFVCISVDSKADYEKWRSFVTEKHLDGIQLISDKALDSDFMKFLNVSLIPRNVLIDPQGNIISSAGLRPSSAVTRETLAKYIGAPVIKSTSK
jgi:thiol-disulfide isomerase/thioredoxin